MRCDFKSIAGIECEYPEKAEFFYYNRTLGKFSARCLWHQFHYPQDWGFKKIAKKMEAVYIVMFS